MEDTFYLGPESPADLWWSQGAKNPRIVETKVLNKNGPPKGDTNSYTSASSKVHFSEMTNFVYKKLDFGLPKSETNQKAKNPSENGTLESETTAKLAPPEDYSLRSHCDEPQVVTTTDLQPNSTSGLLDSDTKDPDDKKEKSKEFYNMSNSTYRQPKDETLSNVPKKKQLPIPLKKLSGCERRKKKYVQQRYMSPKMNEIRDGVKNLNLHYSRVSRKNEPENVPHKFRREYQRHFYNYNSFRTESFDKSQRFQLKNSRDFPELPKKDEFGNTIKPMKESCPKWTRKNSPAKRHRDDQKAPIENVQNTSTSYKKTRYRSPPITTPKQSRTRSESLSRSHYEPSQKRAYSAIVKNKLDAVIINEDHPEGILTPQQSDLIIDKLISTLVEYPSTSADNIPRFQGYDLVKGILNVTCVDESSLEWLINNPLLDIFENAKLKVMRASQFARLKRVTAFIPGPTRENADILKLLKLQNKELNTQRWRIYHKDEVPSGTSFVFGLDDASIEVLKSLDMQPYYGMARAEFYVSPKRRDQPRHL